MSLEGGCACGAIRYRFQADPLIVQACHCRDCQRLSGSAFALNMWIETKFVDVSGAEPASFQLKGGSGKAHDVFFCAQCGTKLWSKYAAAPGDYLFVAAGTLDKPDSVQPAAHIYTRTKLPWVELSDSIPVFEVFYDVAKFWPPESLKRLKANTPA